MGPEPRSGPESEPRLEELELSKKEEPDSPKLSTEDNLEAEEQDVAKAIVLESGKEKRPATLLSDTVETKSEYRSELLDAEAKYELSKRRVWLVSEEKQALNQEYRACQVKCQESLHILRVEVQDWKSKAERHEDKAMTSETAIDSWRNTVGLFVYYVGGMLVDELQMALDKEAGGIRLQKSEVGIRIGKRESNDRKERVTFHGKRRPVIKDIENFYKKVRKKCFSKQFWVKEIQIKVKGTR